jgi:hypothetical protein
MGMGGFQKYTQLMTFFSWNYVDFERDVLVIDAPLCTRNGPGFGMTEVKECLFRRNARSEGLKRVKNVAFDYCVGVWRKGESGEHLQQPSMLVSVREEVVGNSLVMFKGLECFTVIVRSKDKWLSSECVRLFEDKRWEGIMGIAEDTRRVIGDTFERLRGQMAACDGDWVCPRVEWVRIAKVV